MDMRTPFKEVPLATATVLGEPPADRAYRSLKNVQKTIGMERIRMGALLCVLEQTGQWKGRSAGHTFRRFLQEEGIEPKAAMQYMRVAQVFVLNLQLPASELEKICAASMRTLSVAADVINLINMTDVIDIVATLPRPEAIETLEAYRSTVSEPLSTRRISQPVGKILDQVSDLTMEGRAELFAKLGLTMRNRNTA